MSSSPSRYYAMLIAFIFLNLSFFIGSVTAQYSIENCEIVEIEFSDSCSQFVSLENRIIPIDGISSDSFDVDVRIDLWGDGTIDVMFATDTLNANNLAAYIEFYPRILSNEDFLLTLTDDLYLSCNDHIIYWRFEDEENNVIECTQIMQTRIEKLEPINDTIEYEFVQDQFGGFNINIWDIDFSEIDVSSPFDTCLSDEVFSFEREDYKPTVSLQDGLLDYECTLFSSVYYHSIYLLRGLGCDYNVDTLTLKVNYAMPGSDYLPHQAGSMQTIEGNNFNTIDFTHNSCDYSFWFFSSFNEPCKLWYAPRVDDFSTGRDTFIIEKIDTTILGLTTKDILLMRAYILNGDSISSGFAFSGDFSNNGGISTLDQVLLTKSILMLDNYDFDESWLFELDTFNSPGFSEGDISNQFFVDPDSTTSLNSFDNFLFTGYKKGDLDGSFKEDSWIFGGSCPYITYDTIDVQLINQQIITGDQFSIPIILNQDASIAGIHFGLSSDLVEDVTVSSGVLDLSSDMLSNSVDSNFVAIWMDNNLIRYDYSRGEVLFWINLTAKADFNLYDLFQHTPEFPREVYVNGDYETFTMGFGEFGLSSTAEVDRITDLKIYPNPHRGDIVIQNGKENLSDVVMELYDLGGRVIKTQALDDLSADQSVNLNMSSVHGIHFLKLRSEQGVFTKKLITLE